MRIISIRLVKRGALADTYIIPRDQFDKVLVERDTSLGIKNRGCGCADKVGGNDCIVSIFKDSLGGIWSDSSQLSTSIKRVENAL